MTVNSIKWYKTPGGKIALGVAIVGVLTGIGFAVKHFFFDKQAPTLPPAKTDTTDINTSSPAQVVKTDYVATELPNLGKGCGTVKKDFDKAYNYVKCDGVWWVASKNGTPITAKWAETADKSGVWVSIAKNKTATDLLDNKYTGL